MPENTPIPAFNILLGGVGGDSHSVGLHTIRYALSGSGFAVHFLGCQNNLEDFFRLASSFNVVMISNMDGHARYYLKAFPDLAKKYGLSQVIWYLGGYIDSTISPSLEKYFLDLGFDRVFFRYQSFERVLETLRKDLADHFPKPDIPDFAKKQDGVPENGAAVEDHALDLNVFSKTRGEVLEHWRTGSAARSLDENAAFLKRQPSFAMSQIHCQDSCRIPLVQPRCGVPNLEQQIKMYQTFKRKKLPVLSFQVDSFTRNNNYAAVEEALRLNRGDQAMYLNGFPIVNHGVASLRKVARTIGLPLQSRHSTRDPRLLAEISYAGGITSFEGGAICYNIPYYKNYPLDEAIRNWQYVDRLTGLYYEQYGIVLDREFFGTLTATLIPPSLAIVVNILEALLAARQGVRCISLGYAEQGNRTQDIAAIHCMRELAAEVLANMGFKVQINTVFQQYMAAFPENYERAVNLIYHSAVTARLSGATRILVKTPVEALQIPTLEDNCRAADIVFAGIASVDKPFRADDAYLLEKSMIRGEVMSMLEATLIKGRGCLASGIVNVFRDGTIDVPFSPSLYNRGTVMTARDSEGGVRYLSFGNLPFDREIKDFHTEKMGERRRLEGIRAEREGYRLVFNDVVMIPNLDYPQWPLS